jgi:hypothetical protein
VVRKDASSARALCEASPSRHAQDTWLSHGRDMSNLSRERSHTSRRVVVIPVSADPPNDIWFFRLDPRPGP